MHANWRPESPFKQRFEFGALEARGSSWATDWLHTVRGLNELAHVAGAPCAGASASVPCRSKESKRGKRRQHPNVAGDRKPNKKIAKPPPPAGPACPPATPRAPSLNNPPRAQPPNEQM